jgi:pentatricopeptide repeat protein
MGFVLRKKKVHLCSSPKWCSFSLSHTWIYFLHNCLVFIFTSLKNWYIPWLFFWPVLTVPNCVIFGTFSFTCQTWFATNGSFKFHFDTWYFWTSQEVEPDSSIYNTVIHGLCLRGKTILARKVYKKMQSIGLTPDGKTRSFMLQHISSAE